MMTLYAALGSLILALIAVISWLVGKKGTSDTLNANQGIKDQINSMDGQIAKNQAQEQAIDQAQKEKEANETNQDVIDGINSNKSK